MSLVRKAISIVANNGNDWLATWLRLIKINKHMTFRPVGADYYLTRMPDFLTQNLSNHHHHNSNNFRYTAGVNFVFGNEK